MNKTTFYRIFLILFVGSMLVACATASPLTGATWHLVSYGSASKPTPAIPDVETSLTFDDAGKVGGNVGCNSFGGEYEIRGEKITFNTLTSTLMACEEPRMQQETAVFNLLTGTLDFKVSGNTLTISSPDGSSALVLNK